MHVGEDEGAQADDEQTDGGTCGEPQAEPKAASATENGAEQHDEGDEQNVCGDVVIIEGFVGAVFLGDENGDVNAGAEPEECGEDQLEGDAYNPLGCGR